MSAGTGEKQPGAAPNRAGLRLSGAEIGGQKIKVKKVLTNCAASVIISLALNKARAGRGMEWISLASNAGRDKRINPLFPPGGIAQLGERLNGIQEVSGSIPLISTKKQGLMYLKSA